jgi:5,10-methylenetetrahydromethanopterin reductase
VTAGLVQRQVWLHGFPVPGGCDATAAQAERLGFDGLLLANSQNLIGDVFVELGMLTRATSRLGPGTGVINPLTRHPAVTAAAIASVQQESGGRAVLGVGRGDSSLAQLGLARPSTARLRKFVSQVRGFLHGETVTVDGRASRIGWITGRAVPPVPVELAATGPATIAVAAVAADRVMLTVGADRARVASGIEAARQARIAAGLDPAALQMGATSTSAVTLTRQPPEPGPGQHSGLRSLFRHERRSRHDSQQGRRHGDQASWAPLRRGPPRVVGRGARGKPG